MSDDELRRVCVAWMDANRGADHAIVLENLATFAKQQRSEERAAVLEEAAQQASTFTKGYDVGWLLRATKQDMAKRILKDFSKHCEQRAKELKYE